MAISSFAERLAQQGRVQAIPRVTSGSPEEIVLKLGRTSPDVIAATLALAQRGTTMLKAKRAVEKVLKEGDAVIDLPPLGFAWVPRSVEKGAKVRLPKQSIVDGNTLRNDYLALEIDPQSGGLRSIRDAARQIPRLGQQLVFAPGSTMKCRDILVVKNGHAVGEDHAAMLWKARRQVAPHDGETFGLQLALDLFDLRLDVACGLPGAGEVGRQCQAGLRQRHQQRACQQAP